MFHVKIIQNLDSGGFGCCVIRAEALDFHPAFEISSFDTSSGALVDSQIANLLEFVKPMYRGQKVYFPGKYNIESVCNGGGGSLFDKDAKSWRQLLMDLEDAGMKQGCHLVGNGGGRK